MGLVDKTVKALLEDFRSSQPTPGGGSAAALSGAIGASLLAMVAALPQPRAHAPADVETLAEVGRKATALAVALEALVDRDSEAYELVVSAYRMAKGTDEEKTARSMKIQEALKAAIAAPLAVMRCCATGLGLVPTLATLGNPNASSDVQVARELMRAGLRGARLNVEINLTSVKDTSYHAAVTSEVSALAEVSESGGTDVPSESA
jgi:formiminotetrahydrofolate cyclodeaminase